MQRLLASIALLLLFGLANADAQLVTAISGGNALSGGPGTLGWEFTVGTTPLTLATLGVFDEFSDGVLSQSHEVGIWTSAGQSLIASVNVTPQATLVNGFFYANLSVPVTLQANTTYRIGAQYADIDLDLSRGNVPRANVSVNSDVTLLDAYLSTGSGFQYPDLNVSGADAGFWGPNAGFAPVPEPSAYASLAGLALVAFAFIRRIVG